MPVPVQTPSVTHTGNGITTVFAFPFKLIDAENLRVMIGATIKTLGVDYTVSGLGGNSGTVTMSSPPSFGVVVNIYRSTPLARVRDYQQNGDLLADTLDLDFDYIWMALQEMQNGPGGTAISANDVSYDPLAIYDAGTIGKALQDLFDFSGDNIWSGYQRWVGGRGDPEILPDPLAGSTGLLLEVAYTSLATAVGTVNSPFFVDHEVPADSHGFEWTQVIRQTNYAGDDGENVAFTAQNFKYNAAGNSWAGVFQAHDYSGNSGSGILVPLEVDLLANGTVGEAGRNGMHMVFGKGNPLGAMPFIDSGIKLNAAGGDKSQANLTKGIDIELNCSRFFAVNNFAGGDTLIDLGFAGNILEFLRLRSDFANPLHINAGYSNATRSDRETTGSFPLHADGFGGYLGRLVVNIDGDRQYYVPIYVDSRGA